MFDVPTFLMRWLFLSNIIRDVAEIQTMPQQPYYPPPPPQHEQEVEAHWKDQCLRGILSYPPGSQRLLVMDALRVELTNQLGHELQAAEDCIKRLAAYNKYRRNHHHHQQQRHGAEILDPQQHHHSNEQRHRGGDENIYNENDENDGDDPYLDADVEIVKAAFEKMQKNNADGKTTTTTTTTTSQTHTRRKRKTVTASSSSKDDEEAVLEISARGTSLRNIHSNSHTTSVDKDKNDSPHDDENQSGTSESAATTDSTSEQHVVDSPSQTQQQPPTEEEMARARKTLRQTRDLLPQLVAALLKSPHNTADAVGHNHAQHYASSSSSSSSAAALPHPIQRLRNIILGRCLEDPSWGIELCWLLEAEVGRAWKTLFEHRQQTGRRLIVVLPAEKAAVLAKIGTEKREAFDLLQDAEQATAYGYTPTIDHTHHQDNGHDRSMVEYGIGSSALLPPPRRLPSSLCLRRCSHFGDAMHFIDRLTQVSLDLRMMPVPERMAYLHERLDEMNRRIRRRMVTKGDVSLDVEDGRSPYDWPQIHDLQSNMLKYSVHFPFVPQTGEWPTTRPPQTATRASTADASNQREADASQFTDEKKHHEDETGKPLVPQVVRVLNIVTPESRILSSRERCPFLVQMEVADTGLGGNDARLYATGANGLGSTVEEALGMNPMASAAASSAAAAMHSKTHSAPGEYEIPPELMEEHSSNIGRRASRVKPWGVNPSLGQTVESDSDDQDNEGTSPTTPVPPNGPQSFAGGDFARGGSQGGDQSFFHEEDAGYMYPDPDGYVQQQQYERLHQEMQQPVAQQAQHAPAYHPAHSFGYHHQQQPQQPMVSLGAALLNQIYGEPWAQRCEEIRKASPFGQVEGWRLASFIMKAGEDIRREALVMQVISSLSKWFDNEIPLQHRPFMRPYTIMCVGGDAGVVECLSDAKSVDEVKKKTDSFVSLRDYFERAYGPPARRQQQHSMNGHYRALPPAHSSSPGGGVGGMTFERAQENFLRSLVGYSLVCYVLQIKDRHNANILLDREGHIVHIDFGFVLGDTPKMGKVPLFSERAPFKLSAEFWEVLGGWNVSEGGLGVKFCKMFEWAFMCAAAHAEEIATMVETTLLALDDNPRVARMAASGVKSRLRMRGPPGSVQQKMFIMDLVNAALTSWGTSTYDWLQKSMNGYQ